MNNLSCKNITKKALVALLVFALFLPVNTVYAGASVEAKIQKMEIGNNQFTVYVDQKQGDIFYPDAASSFASLGKQECKILDCKNLIDANLGVVYDCIVDVSGSMDKSRIADVKEMLTQLNQEKKKEDFIKITRMANERTSTDFLSDTDKIDEAIAEIEVTHEDTNFYESLKKEAEELIGNRELPRRRCILVFSDGIEDQKKGITKEETIKTINSYDIPVFTVAMLKKKPAESDIEMAKQLGSFARSSYGGMHYAPVVDGSEYESIVREIQAIGNDSLVVTIDLSKLHINRKSADLYLKLVSGGFVSEINYTIDQETAIQLLLSGDEKTEKEAEITETDDSAAETSNEQILKESETKTDNLLLIIVIAVCFGIMILSIILVIVFASKGNKSGKKKSTQKRGLTLTRLKDSSTINKKMTKNLSFGREKKCDFCIPDDDALSDTHCFFIFEDGRVYVNDNNSTNGVFVNGVPQFGKCMLSQGDVVLIGSYEYRVSWA